MSPPNCPGPQNQGQSETVTTASGSRAQERGPSTHAQKSGPAPGGKVGTPRCTEPGSNPGACWRSAFCIPSLTFPSHYVEGKPELGRRASSKHRFHSGPWPEGKGDATAGLGTTPHAAWPRGDLGPRSLTQSYSDEGGPAHRPNRVLLKASRGAGTTRQNEGPGTDRIWREEQIWDLVGVLALTDLT